MRNKWEGSWSAVKELGHTCTVLFFQMDDPGTTHCQLHALLGPILAQEKWRVRAYTLKKAVEAVQQRGRLWLARRALAPPQQKLA